MTSIAPEEIVDTERVSPETTTVGLEVCTKKTPGMRRNSGKLRRRWQRRPRDPKLQCSETQVTWWLRKKLKRN